MDPEQPVSSSPHNVCRKSQHQFRILQTPVDHLREAAVLGGGIYSARHFSFAALSSTAHILCLTFAVIALTCPILHAQENLPIWNPTAVLPTTILPKLTLEDLRAPAPPIDETTLEFAPTRAGHAAAVESVAAFFAQGSGERLDDVSTFLADHDIPGEFASILHRMNMNKHDLGDALTAYLILSWEVVTNGDASNQRNGIQALRRKLHRVLLESTQVRNATEESKQQTAETLAYLAVLAAASQNDLAKGDERALSILHAAVNAAALSLTGLDLRHLKLSANGFENYH